MKVLVTGNYGHREFSDAVAWLTEHAALEFCADPDQAVQQLANAPECPHVIVVAQSYPGQFSTFEVERLHRAAPLARLVALLGSWCEGEARSSPPWPGVFRVFWHEWAGLWSREFFASDDHLPRFLALPRTATRAERSLDERASATGRGLIGVHATSFAAFDAIADVCSAGGFGSVWLSQTTDKMVRKISAIIWDSTVLEASDFERLEQIVVANRLSPVLACVCFPRLTDVQALREIGVAEVLAKPFSLAGFHRRLEKCLALESVAKHVA